jgi:hypothetical protein
MGGLESSITKQEFWSSVGYWAMVCGLVGEVAVLAIPTHRERLEKVLSAIFTIVIIFGLATEHRAETQISGLISRQQQAAKLQIAQLNKEASEAREVEAQANEQVATLEKQAASLQESAEHEHLARMQIESAIAPRLLTEKQEKAISEACRAFAKPDVHVLIKATAGYGMSLGTQIASALTEGGFSVQRRYTGRAFYEVSAGAPLRHFDAASCIVGTIMKKGNMPIMGVISVLPKGSPITIAVGERLIGALPK